MITDWSTVPQIFTDRGTQRKDDSTAENVRQNSQAAEYRALAQRSISTARRSQAPRRQHSLRPQRFSDTAFQPHSVATADAIALSGGSLQPRINWRADGVHAALPAATAGRRIGRRAPWVFSSNGRDWYPRHGRGGFHVFSPGQAGQCGRENFRRRPMVVNRQMALGIEHEDFEGSTIAFWRVLNFRPPWISTISAFDRSRPGPRGQACGGPTA